MSNSFLRSQSFVTVGASSKVLLPANVNRRAALVSAPVYELGNASPNNSTVAAADGTAIGVRQTLSGVANRTITATQASAVHTAGAAPVMALQFNDGTNVFDLARGTTPLYWSGRVDLPFGASLQWNVITVGAGATVNLAILANQTRTADRVTLSFGRPAVLDQGINLFFGGAPLLLIADLFGSSITEEITFIGSTGQGTVGVLEILAP